MPSTSTVRVRGLDRTGTVCLQRTLRHGDDPHEVLREHGWEPAALISITMVHRPQEAIALDYRVVRVPARARPEPSDVPHAPGLTICDGELPVRYQRVAAYAVVTSARGTLLSQASARTGTPGHWGLPGGGLDPGEEPDVAVVREVWEETGQHVQLTAPLDVITQHWVGRAPSGRLEDFHAIRMIYWASCSTPTDPVVHDVGGTTAASAWMRPADLAQAQLSTWAIPLLSRALV